MSSQNTCRCVRKYARVRRATRSLLLLLAFTAPGCRALQLKHDQADMRCALLDLYTNQVMDNLIRAHDGYPIVQLDYSHATGTITQTGNAGFNGGQTVTTERGGMLAIASRTIATAYNYSFSAEQMNQLTVTAEPVLNNNEVYDAYLEFLKPDPDRGAKLVVSKSAPPCGTAHICRQCGNLYYWVPKEFALDFLRLSLVTTVERGQPLSIPRYFEGTIVEAHVRPLGPGHTSNSQNAEFLITLNKKLPNDDGHMLITIDNMQYKFEIAPYLADTNTDPSKLTSQLTLVYSSTAPDGPKLPVAEMRTQLENASVKFTFTHYQPSIPTTEDLIEDLRSQVELLRLDQHGRRL